MRVLIFFTFCLIIQNSIALDATTASEAKDAIETYFKENNGWLAKTIRLSKSQCGNFIVFVSLRFYVESILGILDVQNQPF